MGQIIAHLLIHQLDKRRFSGNWRIDSEADKSILSPIFEHSSGNLTSEIEIKKYIDSTHKLHIDLDLHDGFYRDQLVLLRWSFHPVNATVSEDEKSFSFKSENVLMVKIYQKELTDYGNQKWYVTIEAESEGIDKILMKINSKTDWLPSSITIELTSPYKGNISML